MNARELLQLYRATLWRGWLPALLIAILTTVFLDRLMAALPDPLAPDGLERLTQFFNSVSLWRSALAVSLLALWPVGALVLCADANLRGVAPPAAGGLLAALRAYPRTLLAGLLFAAVVVAGLTLLLIPGIYLAGVLQLWMVALLLQRIGAWRSLRASWQLVYGRWWRSNTQVALILLGGLGAAALLSLIAGVVVQLLDAALHPGPAPQRAAALGISLLVNFVAAPAYSVALLVSYRDLQHAPGG